MAQHYRVETSDLMQALRKLAEEDAPIVTAYALTKTAQDIKAAEGSRLSPRFSIGRRASPLTRSM